METFWENDQRPEFVPILGPKWLKIGPLRPIFSTPLKYLQWAYEVILMRNQWKLLRKWSKTGIGTYFRTQNWPLTHILHTLKCSLKDHAKRYWWESSDTFLRKWPKTRSLDLFWGPKIGPLRPVLYTSLKVAAKGIWNKIDVNPGQTFNKIVENLHLLHTYKSSSNELTNQVSSESIGNFSRK